MLELEEEKKWTSAGRGSRTAGQHRQSLRVAARVFVDMPLPGRVISHCIKSHTSFEK